jgi:oxygen-independent coproporphyrinogen-3 oxidase
MLEGAQSPAAAREVLGVTARLTEKVMLGVRLREGLDVAELPAAAQERVSQLVSWGLVEAEAGARGKLSLTVRGRLLADAVVRELLD